MVQEHEGKRSKMVKSKKEPITPRRRLSVSKTGGISKVTRALSRPVSGAAPRGAPPAANIKVLVRVRPPSNREEDDNYHTVVKVVSEQTLIFDPKEDEQPFFYHGVQQKTRDLLKKAKKDISFVFDKVFNTNSTNMEVFLDSTSSLIDTLMDGYNCSVFAYGATGAGKTFTMIGNAQSPGITYLTMKELFNRKENLSNDRDFELMLTYIEVYNELVKDLLNPGPPLNLREDAKYGVMIPGVKGHKINSADDLFSLLEQGNKRRTQHPTDANAESSRSHAVFQVYIQMTMKGTSEVRRAKLSMIDLAGSERGSATGFVGARFKEGANINKSLLALGNCINSLADGHRHVPYRDSKLTRLLKDSLGGNCHTIMIANVSPSSLSFDDTYNTLKYAARAKKIKSNITRNILSVDMHMDQYIKLSETLKEENSSLKFENIKLKREIEQLRTEMEQNTPKVCDKEQTKKIEDLTKECDDLRERHESLLISIRTQSPKDSINADLSRQVEALKQKANLYHQQMEALSLENVELKTENAAMSANNTDIVQAYLDPQILEQFKKLIEEKKEFMEREYQLQCSELGMSLRRELKTETKTRLSSFYIETSDKDEMRRKLNEQVERSERKEKCTSKEIEDIRRKIEILDEEIRNFTQTYPEINESYKFEKLELQVLGNKYKTDLKQKERDILWDDHKEKCNVLENMSCLLKTLFLAVGGKHDAPESIKADYENLVAAFNGKRTIKWQESGVPLPPDSGMSSLTSIADPLEEKNRASKRKIETDSQLSLDSTFTRSPNPGGSNRTPNSGGKQTVNAHVMAKGGFKAPAAKRMANGVSPRFKTRVSPRSKENLGRKPIVRPDTARLLARKAVPKTLSDKPRFRT